MNKETTSGGVGFLGLLTIAFVVLKLCGVIAWSWWWVLFPAYGPLTVLLVLWGLAALFVVVIDAIWPDK